MKLWQNSSNGFQHTLPRASQLFSEEKLHQMSLAERIHGGVEVLEQEEGGDDDEHQEERVVVED